MFKFLPMGYTFHSRLLSTSEKVSWIVIYPVLTLVIVVVGNWPSENLFNTVFQWFMLFLVVNIVYEIGYLHNDLIVTQTEESPTLRGDYESNRKIYTLLVASRALFLVAFFWGISLFDKLWLMQLAIFAMIAVLVFFAFHNKVRSRFNVLSYFLLSSSKYVFPVLVVFDIEILISTILVFPLVRTLEHATKNKYGFAFLKYKIGGFDTFRVWYYMVVVVLGLILFTLTETYLLLATAGFMLLYRVLTLVASKKLSVSRNKHPGY